MDAFLKWALRPKLCSSAGLFLYLATLQEMSFLLFVVWCQTVL